MEEAKKSISGAKIDKLASTKALDYIIGGAIALVFFLVPIFFTGTVVQGIGFEKMIVFYFLVLLGIVAWVTKGVISGELDLRRTPLDLPILGFTVLMVVSTMLSINAKDSLIGYYGNSSKGLVAYLVFVLFYYLVVNNTTAKVIKAAFWSLIGSTALVIIFSLLQLYGKFILPFAFTKYNSFNPFGSLSGLTMFLSMSLPMMVIAMAQLDEILGKAKPFLKMALKIVLGILALGNLAILALLNGFTFWPAVVVGMVIILMFFLSKIIKISNNNLVIPITGFLISIILLVLGNFNLIDLKLPAEVSLSRKASWDIAKNSIKQDPIFGSGPSTFYYSFSKFKSADFNNTPLWNVRFDSATGLIFELVATLGIVGALAFLVILLTYLSTIFLSLIKGGANELHSIQLAMFSSSVMATLFIVLYSLNNSIILVMVSLFILAMGISMTINEDKFKVLKLSFRASAKYALALAAIFLSVSAGFVVLFTMGLKMYMADFYANKSLAAADETKKIELLGKAVTLAPYQDIYYLNLANNYMILANKEALGARNQQSIQSNLSLAIENGKKAIELAGNKAANNESMGLIYENASFYTRGALEWAEQLYKKEIELDPNNPTPYLRIALVNMARANAETDQNEKKFYIEEAIKKYDEAISKKQDLAPAFYGKSIAYEKINELSKAIDDLKNANIYARDNLDYRFELGRLYFNRGVTQPNLSQKDAKAITEQGMKNDAQPGGTDVSVQPNQAVGKTTGRNEDINMAEQLFLSILMVNPNHANAEYSLAVLYQKIGDNENAKKMVKQLLSTLNDDATKEAVKKQFPGLY